MTVTGYNFISHLLKFFMTWGWSERKVCTEFENENYQQCMNL